MNFFLVYHLKLPSFRLKTFPIILSLHTTVKSPTPTFLQPPLSTEKILQDISAECSSSGWTTTISHPDFIGELVQPSDHPYGLPLERLWLVQILFMQVAPELNIILQMCLQKWNSWQSKEDIPHQMICLLWAHWSFMKTCDLYKFAVKISLVQNCLWQN